LINGSTTTPNAIGGWGGGQGNLVAQYYQGGSNPLGNGNINLHGATPRVLTDGDHNTSSPIFNLGNNIFIGSNTCQLAASATIDLNTIYGTNNSSANDKTIAFGDLTFGGALGAPVLQTTTAPNLSQSGLTASSHSYNFQFDGTVTMVNGANFNLGANNGG